MPMNRENQEAIDKCLRGFYSNSFFHIYIDGDFNPTISNVSSQKDKGTALHEYLLRKRVTTIYSVSSG